ncbi:MAG TPA: efflux RND transporter permease subunit, partial [Victivallales bacterium]|nr:efflux RND transporter permease subunit [Victivallales bacterium]
WVAFSIPVSIAGTFIVMKLTGISVNILSLFGLIMVIGFIVDVGVVVSDSISKSTGNGSRLDDIVSGVKRVALPVTAAICTIILGFMPILLISGAWGQLIKGIPIIVIAALAFSLFEGLFILPSHLRNVNFTNGTDNVSHIKRFQKKFSEGLELFISKIYLPLIRKLIKYRYSVLCAGLVLCLLVSGLIVSQKIGVIFFPNTEQDNVHAELQVQPGTPDSVKRILARKLMKAWEKVGNKYRAENGGRLYSGAYTAISGNTIVFHTGLVPPEQRIPYLSSFLGGKMRENFGNYPEVVSDNYSVVSNTPEVVYNISGTDPGNILKAADKVMEKFKSYNGVYSVGTNYKYGERTFAIKLKPAAYSYNLNLSNITSQIQNGYASNEILKLQRGQDEVSVVLSYLKNGRNSVQYFDSMDIKTPDGHLVPLSEVAKIRLEQTPQQIERYNGLINIQVSAKVNTDITTPNIIRGDMSKSFIPSIAGMYGVSFSKGGNAVEEQNIMNTFMITIPLIILVIYLIIALTLQSYLQPLAVLLTIPLAVACSILTLYVFGLPLSMIAIFGISALIGIKANNSIVLNDEINNRLKEGFSYFDAVTGAAQRRFKAIMLTAMTTFLGLLPLLFNKSELAPYFYPMGVTIAFGVLFGMVINLLIVPCIHTILNDIRCILHYYIFRKMPSREEVEPCVKNKYNKVYTTTVSVQHQYKNIN